MIRFYEVRGSEQNTAQGNLQFPVKCGTQDEAEERAAKFSLGGFFSEVWFCEITPEGMRQHYVCEYAKARAAA